MIRIDHISYYAKNRDRSRGRTITEGDPSDGAIFDRSRGGTMPDRSGTILDDLSFTIPPGACTVLLGPNGAGKSTLLRIISGEKRPAKGEVTWQGRSVHSIPPLELARQRGMLTQHYSVNLPFTVEEVVAMGRYPHDSRSDAASNRIIVRQCLQEVQADHLTGRLFSTLSGGEQQRVQLARVLAQLTDTNSDVSPGIANDQARGANAQPGIPAHHSRIPNPQPKMLLLDEPTASMDWLHQQLCLQKARAMAAQGHTVIIVLHDLNLAAQFADLLVLLKKGRLLAIGKPADLLTPGLIAEAYGIQTSVLYADHLHHPVIVPAGIVSNHSTIKSAP